LPIQALLDLDVSTSIAGPVCVGKELKCPLAILHCVVPGDATPFLETKDAIRFRLQAYWTIGLS
jgi:hypothetical protein